MKKTFKRLIALVLTFVMLIGCVPFTNVASAAGDNHYFSLASIEFGERVTNYDKVFDDLHVLDYEDYSTYSYEYPIALENLMFPTVSSLQYYVPTKVLIGPLYCSKDDNVYFDGVLCNKVTDDQGVFSDQTKELSEYRADLASKGLLENLNYFVCDNGTTEYYDDVIYVVLELKKVHRVKTETCENGRVFVNAINQGEGDTIKLAARPKEGYVLDHYEWIDGKGIHHEIKVDDDEDGDTFEPTSYTLPLQEVGFEDDYKISAVFKPATRQLTEFYKNAIDRMADLLHIDRWKLEGFIKTVPLYDTKEEYLDYFYSLFRPLYNEFVGLPVHKDGSDSIKDYIDNYLNIPVESNYSPEELDDFAKEIMGTIILGYISMTDANDVENRLAFKYEEDPYEDEFADKIKDFMNKSYIYYEYPVDYERVYGVFKGMLSDICTNINAITDPDDEKDNNFIRNFIKNVEYAEDDLVNGRLEALSDYRKFRNYIFFFTDGFYPYSMYPTDTPGEYDPEWYSKVDFYEDLNDKCDDLFDTWALEDYNFDEMYSYIKTNKKFKLQADNASTLTELKGTITTYEDELAELDVILQKDDDQFPYDGNSKEYYAERRKTILDEEMIYINEYIEKGMELITYLFNEVYALSESIFFAGGSGEVADLLFNSPEYDGDSNLIDSALRVELSDLQNKMYQVADTDSTNDPYPQKKIYTSGIIDDILLGEDNVMGRLITELTKFDHNLPEVKEYYNGLRKRIKEFLIPPAPSGGGSSGSVSYKAIDTKNTAVEIKGTGSKGTTRTIVPKEGRKVLSVKVVDKKNNPIGIVENTDGTYSFVQPNCDVNVEVVYARKTIKLTIGSTEASVDGDVSNLDVTPVIRNDRTMLPIRFVAENLGAKVDWDEKDPNTVLITKGDIKIEITLGSDIAKVNGKEYKLDSVAFAENDRTYLPVRFVSENLNAVVEWNELRPMEVKIYER